MKYQATPQIVVLEWQPQTLNSEKVPGVFKVIQRDTVPRSEFTLDNAVEKIISFNKVYNPAFIYVDRGFGEYQIEMLRKRGILAKEVGPKDPAYGLDTKVKGVAGNQNIELRDPATKRLDKKPAKPFMVNQTVLMFERNRIIINKNDQLMWRQIENYQVVRLGVDGRPTFTSTNEHTLDALMLAILGFTQEFPDVTNTIFTMEPTRKMDIAPPIKTSKPNFDLSVDKQIEKDKEFFSSPTLRKNYTPQWNKVKDLKKAKEKRKARGERTSKSLITQRGFGNKKKPFSRPTF